MNIIKYLLCKNSGMSNGESFLRASTNMPISGGAAKVIEKTVPFADIISITDALARPAVDLQSEITAQQNLNGYEYPWVGGAGKNKINVADVSGSTTSYYVQFPTNFVLTADVTYTFSADITTNVEPFNFTVGCGSATYQRDIKSYNTSSTAMSGRLSITFTPTAEQLEGRPNLYIRAPRYGQSETFTYSVKNMQLEIGSIETAYEPYENICPISGRTEVNVTRTGKNLFDKNEAVVGKFINISLQEITNSAKSHSGLIPVKPSTSYFMNGYGGDGYFAILAVDENLQPIRWYGAAAKSAPFTATTPSNCHYVYLNFNTDLIDTMAFYEGSADEGYIPYEGDTYPTALGRTVYGGTLDLTTGELTITHEYARIGDLTIDPYTWSMENEHTVVFAITQSTWGRDYKFKCDSYAVTIKNRNDLENGEMTGEAARLYFRNDNFTTKQEFQTALADVNIVFKLLVPRKYTLTPTEVQMLLGNNTIWADAGRVQLTYYAPKED